MGDTVDVVVIGAGQAGLAVSHELSAAGVEHMVLERGRVAETWRGRWDSFCLVTPNWTVRLPGGSYGDGEPDGFMERDAVVAHLERYAAAAPVREGVEVTALHALDGGFRLETSDGAIAARQVVVATGAYQRPHRPPAAASFPAGPLAIDVDGYRNPGELPDGAVLVVGSGQSGCQIAEELQLAGRDTYLACGRAPWAPRRFGGHDLLWWANETGFLDVTPDKLPSPDARLAANIQATGRDGGHDLHYRTLRALGVTLLGRLLGASGRRARFADDLAESVVWGDARRADLKGLVARTCDARGLPRPELPDPEPFSADGAPDELDLSTFGAVVFATGYRPAYGDWVHVPGAFDERGFPLHADGASTAAEGLYFAGVHFLRKRKSSLLIGVGEDAALVARAAAGRLSGASAA
jgi:putative flavoprotein involved in K+ transport